MLCTHMLHTCCDVLGQSIESRSSAAAPQPAPPLSCSPGRASGRLPRRRKGADGKELSAGFGFVECSSEEVAKLALQQLQARALERAATPAVRLG
jgi:hypothetical protein